MYDSLNCSPHLWSTATGKPSSCRRSASALGSWCTHWHPPCVTRSTFMVSGPLAGTPTRVRSCRTTTMTRRAPSSPPNGRNPISCQLSSNSSTRCIQRDCWSSPSPIVLKAKTCNKNSSSSNSSPTLPQARVKETTTQTNKRFMWFCQRQNRGYKAEGFLNCF